MSVLGHVLISSPAWPGLGWSDYVKIHNILIDDITLGTRPGQANFVSECQSGSLSYPKGPISKCQECMLLIGS